MANHSCLENPMDRRPGVHGVAKSRTQLSDFAFLATKHQHPIK